MDGLKVVVLIGLIIVVGTRVAAAFRLPAPVVLLLLGSLFSFVSFVPTVSLPADTVLLLFLPALLFYEASTVSIREIRSNFSVIMLLSVGLVTATAAGVAVVAHWWGLSWPMAWVMGAIVAPTDATALGPLVRRLPRRELTTLKAESLVNDGTALVIYSIAVSVAVDGRRAPSAIDIAARLAGSYAGGIAIGLLVAFVLLHAHRLLHDNRLESALGVLTPFLAYLPAQQVGVSGVVAVVTCGLAQTRYGSLRHARARQQSQGFWQIGTYLLNGALFVLIGLDFFQIVDAMVQVSVGTAVRDGLTATAVVIVLRLSWFLLVPGVSRILDRRPAQRRAFPRQRLPMAWAGCRGAVSLAAALALPLTRSDGSALPDRLLVHFVTYVVILSTLALQGLTMPMVISWARVLPDEQEAQDQRDAERAITEAAVDALPRRALEQDTDPETVRAVREEYQQRLAGLIREQSPTGTTSPGGRAVTRDRQLRRALVADKRRALAALSDRRSFDDIVLRRLQSTLDAEELRLGVATDD